MKENLKENDLRAIEILTNSSQDIGALVAYLLKLNIDANFLTDVLSQVYKVAQGSGNGKISIVIEDGRVRSVHGIENRWVDRDIFLD